MKKLGLLLVACFAFATISVAQNNIVKSLERNVPGQGKVTIHQDARIAALIGSEYVPAGSDEQKVIKMFGFTAYKFMQGIIPVSQERSLCGSYPHQGTFSRTYSLYLFQSPSLAVPCRRFPQYRRSGCHDASVAGYWCIQGSFYRERADKHPLIKNYHVRKRRNCISFIR